MYQVNLLAAVGSTGNVTGPTTRLGSNETVGFQFVVEAIGGTPTVTFKFQGSVDGVNFYDLAYVTDASDTLSVATRTVTTVGPNVAFLSNPGARRYNFYRVVTTANTNITFRAEAYQITK